MEAELYINGVRFHELSEFGLTFGMKVDIQDGEILSTCMKDGNDPTCEGEDSYAFFVLNTRGLDHSFLGYITFSLSGVSKAKMFEFAGLDFNEFVSNPRAVDIGMTY
jgi:hypothetical protein